MQPSELQEHLQKSLPDCEVRVGGDDYHYQIKVVGQRFGGLSAVRKQQEVYKHLSSLIQDGTVHAVTIKALTPEEASSNPGEVD